MYEGNKSEWIIRKEASNGGAYIKSMKRGLVYIPVRGWQYADAGIWQDDDTLTVTGTYIYQFSEFEIIPFTHRRRTNLS